MKVCPKCNQSYTDPGLNFCLADGELLMDTSPEAPTQIFNDPALPTGFMDSPRRTNPNHSAWDQPAAQPIAPWQSPQNLQNNPFGSQFGIKRDQTLPIIAMVLGILSLPLVCCWGGAWLGIPAAIVGYLGMRNADSDPERYTGRGMAIAGLVMGIVSFLCTMIVIFLQIFAR